MIKIKIEIIFKKESNSPIEKIKTDSPVSEVLEFLKGFRLISSQNSKEVSKEEPDCDSEEKDLPPWGKILRRMGDNRELVEDLVGRMEQPLRSAVDSVPRSLLLPYNQLAMLFKLPHSADIKSKKSIMEFERVKILKFLNDCFCSWFNSDYQLIDEGSNSINELNRTKAILAEIKGSLEGSSN